MKILGIILQMIVQILIKKKEMIQLTGLQWTPVEEVKKS